MFSDFARKERGGAATSFPSSQTRRLFFGFHAEERGDADTLFHLLGQDVCLRISLTLFERSFNTEGNARGVFGFHAERTRGRGHSFPSSRTRRLSSGFLFRRSRGKKSSLVSAFLA